MDEGRRADSPDAGSGEAEAGSQQAPLDGDPDGAGEATPEERVQHLLVLNEKIEELRRSPSSAVHAPLATAIALGGSVLMGISALRLLLSPAGGPWIWFMTLFTGVTAIIMAWMGVDLLAARLDRRRRLRRLEGRLREEEERLARLRREEGVSPPGPLP